MRSTILYNVGGTGDNNGLVSRLRANQMEVSFDFACSATLDESPYPLRESCSPTPSRAVASSTWRVGSRRRRPGG